MPRLFLNQQTENNMTDTYADAILRTFASLKAPPSTPLFISQQYCPSYSLASTNVNEVSIYFIYLLVMSYCDLFEKRCVHSYFL